MELVFSDFLFQKYFSYSYLFFHKFGISLILKTVSYLYGLMVREIYHLMMLSHLGNKWYAFSVTQYWIFFFIKSYISCYILGMAFVKVISPFISSKGSCCFLIGCIQSFYCLLLLSTAVFPVDSLVDHTIFK